MHGTCSCALTHHRLLIPRVYHPISLHMRCSLIHDFCLFQIEECEKAVDDKEAEVRMRDVQITEMEKRENELNTKLKSAQQVSSFADCTGMSRHSLPRSRSCSSPQPAPASHTLTPVPPPPEL